MDNIVFFLNFTFLPQYLHARISNTHLFSTPFSDDEIRNYTTKMLSEAAFRHYDQVSDININFDEGNLNPLTHLVDMTIREGIQARREIFVTLQRSHFYFELNCTAKMYDELTHVQLWITDCTLKDARTGRKKKFPQASYTKWEYYD